MVWETVIGIETHVQLSTKTKLFSRASTEFGKSPNTNVNLIDCGLPGVLPSVNKEAFYKAIRFGMAVGAQINQTSIFDRKNYFYADLPKGYQITQMDLPIVIGGSIEIIIDELTKTINITRAHLEEDAGKSIHDEFEGFSAIDLNRAGTPLLEIVSEPEISNAKEAVAYMKAMHQLVTFLDVSDGNMAQGSLRCDANVSIRKKGDKELGTRTEIKNINSFKFIEKAINFEIKRQIKILENGEKVVQETRLYDSSKDETRPMRSKEFANDYRYFPEPDLNPIKIEEKLLMDIQSSMPNLPNDLFEKFTTKYGLSNYDALVIIEQKEIAFYYESILEFTKNYKGATNWLMGSIKSYLNQKAVEITNFPIKAENIGILINMIDDGIITHSLASQKLFPEMLKYPLENPNSIAEKNQWINQQNENNLEVLIKEILDKNPEEKERFKNGEKKLTGFFIGKIMKASNGTADPKKINQLLNQLTN